VEDTVREVKRLKKKGKKLCERTTLRHTENESANREAADERCSQKPKETV